MQFVNDAYSRFDVRRPFPSHVGAYAAMMNILEEPTSLRLMLGTCQK